MGAEPSPDILFPRGAFLYLFLISETAQYKSMERRFDLTLVRDWLAVEHIIAIYYRADPVKLKIRVIDYARFRHKAYADAACDHVRRQIKAVHFRKRCRHKSIFFEHMHNRNAIRALLPGNYLPEVLERVKRIAAFDEKRQIAIQKATDPLEIVGIMKGIYK